MIIIVRRHSAEISETNQPTNRRREQFAPSVYVHQLQATNGMIHAYQTRTLPKLLEVSKLPVSLIITMMLMRRLFIACK